jgi:hypothetical protein
MIELNVGISDKLAAHIQTTYGSTGNIKVFERQGNYTKIIAFAVGPGAINTALTDIRNRIAEVTEITYDPGSG